MTAESTDEAPRSLDRQLILDTADRIVREHGYTKLTLRRLGLELGADPTSVYRHFRNKGELLVELAERYFELQPVDPEKGWEENLRADLRHAYRRFAVHPDLAILLAVQPYSRPSVGRTAQRLFEHLESAGLTHEQANRMFQFVDTYVAGAGLYLSVVTEDANQNAAGSRAGLGNSHRDSATIRTINGDEPELLPNEEAFEIGLDLLVDAVRQQAARNQAGKRKRR